MKKFSFCLVLLLFSTSVFALKISTCDFLMRNSAGGDPGDTTINKKVPMIKASIASASTAKYLNCPLMIKIGKPAEVGDSKLANILNTKIIFLNLRGEESNDTDCFYETAIFDLNNKDHYRAVCPLM